MKLLKRSKTKANLKADDYRPDSSSPIVTGKQTPAKLKPRYKRPVFILGLIAVLLLGLLAYQYDLSRPKCSDELLQKAGSSIRGTRPAQLSDIAKDIKQTRGYDSDANCLYVVLKDSINKTQTQDAVAAYESLVKVQGDKTEFSPALGDDVDSMDDLKRQVDFLKLFDENLKANQSGTVEP